MVCITVIHTQSSVNLVVLNYKYFSVWRGKISTQTVRPKGLHVRPTWYCCSPRLQSHLWPIEKQSEDWQAAFGARIPPLKTTVSDLGRYWCWRLWRMMRKTGFDGTLLLSASLLLREPCTLYVSSAVCTKCCVLCVCMLHLVILCVCMFVCLPESILCVYVCMCLFSSNRKWATEQGSSPR